MNYLVLATSMLGALCLNVFQTHALQWVDVPVLPKMQILGHTGNNTFLDVLQTIALNKTISSEWRNLMCEPLVLKQLFAQCNPSHLTPAQVEAVRDFFVTSLSQNNLDHQALKLTFQRLLPILKGRERDNLFLDLVSSAQKTRVDVFTIPIMQLTRFF